jgi:8-oxo-dGTP pyrophosphatase MutT (NUDIX family)
LVDPKESPETCAIRELKEESGYMGEVIEGDFGVSPIMFNGKNQLLRPNRREFFHPTTIICDT